MGRDFRINEVESTYKPISFCMYYALKSNGCVKDEEYSGKVAPKELAKVIIGIEQILYLEELPKDTVNEFRFYNDETESDVREHLKEASDKFKEALVWSVALEEDYLSFSYL